MLKMSRNLQESTNAYTYCLTTLGEDATDRELFACVASDSTVEDDNRLYARSIFLVFAASMVFFMQAGFAMLCAGAVRKKNIQNTLLKNLLDACGSSIAFYAVGFAFAFGGMDPESGKKTFVGTSNFFLIDVDDLAFWFFQYAFSAAATTIVAGTLAERCQMAAYLSYSLMLSGWVYPIVVHSIWNYNGFLSANNIDPFLGVGVVDFAGSGVVHLTGGTTALVATMILGPRRGRFHDETGRRLDVPRDFPGHSFSLQMLGTFILWYGWYGFNCGSALLDNASEAHFTVALAATNTTLSGGAAGITALMVNLWYLERYTGEAYFDLKYAMNGSLSGLVAITCGCGVVEPWAAVIIGFVAGLLYIVGSKLLLRFRLDDACDAIPIHGLCGCWGLISVGLLASPTLLLRTYGRDDHPGLFYSWHDGNSDARLLGAQIVGLIFIVGWVTCIMLPFFIWLDWKGWFRSDPLEELVGLDTSYHGGLALLSNHGDESVHPEYISAYKKQRSENNTLRRRRQEVPVNISQRVNTVTGSSDGNRNDSDIDADGKNEVADEGEAGTRVQF